MSVGKAEEAVNAVLRKFGREKMVERFWNHDPSLWKSDLGIQRKINARLGWLTITGFMRTQLAALREFGTTIKKEGFKDVVLLGMGGSSLCPEVCRNTFGISPGYPEFRVLDSTDPATLLHLEEKLDLRKTLFIVASKSGSTIESESLFLYFSKKIKALEISSPGDHWVAITDRGSALEKTASEKHFRRVFLNPPDIGGRYSALSFFGLVPAALIGIDLETFLNRADEVIKRCGSDVPVEENPGAALGAVLSELGREGRDKVTFILPPPIKSFGVWIEQLLAESTGKEGKGLIPVEGEEPGQPDQYGSDRLFIYYRLKSHPDTALDRSVETLRKAGQPVVEIFLRDPYDLAGEFFRWEMATAVAGIQLEINPFDEPNVTESKENTSRILEIYRTSGHLPETQVHPDPSFAKNSGVFLKQVKPSSYVALLAYLERSPSTENLLQKMRVSIRDKFRVATTLGYGPRFLHSTGQLHKGGARKGVFFQITADDPDDVPIPERNYGFSILKRAQSLGDLDSLKKKGLPVLQIHLGRSPEEGLAHVIQLIEGFQPAGGNSCSWG
ncbi:MAG: glucose-6-phosphate isomerase [Nitrospirae bacterium]|nr:glucose-6-phosphate isomerase [Nitrospirota bacterium]MBI3351164.1 glucose-6-phosphate isomerase [Nitrospirota bacterium]